MNILKPLYDDLNTPSYIANLHKLFEKAQKGAKKIKKYSHQLVILLDC